MTMMIIMQQDDSRSQYSVNAWSWNTASPLQYVPDTDADVQYRSM